MKKLIFAFLLIAVLVIGCKSTNDSNRQRNINVTTFSNVEGIEWKLLEVHIDGTFSREILFDRRTLSREGIADIYTAKFDGELVSGVGSPNRYTAPYTIGEEQSINIAVMRSTLMASLFEPEKLPEHQFFGYMQNVYEWQFADGNLIFLSKTEDGRDVRLVFG
ncbi:MAG: META domain-containing protein [Treponema sp.]|jgi:heat shock protein HslJ|nr:META domain-containing protein [Treponema sp.]